MFTFANMFFYMKYDYFCEEVTMNTARAYRLKVALLLTNGHGYAKKKIITIFLLFYNYQV